MALESFDPEALTADHFPLFSRLYDFVQAGYGIDDVLAGTAWAQPRLEMLFSAELARLLDHENLPDLGVELCELFNRHATEPSTKFVFTANQGHAEQKRGNAARARELTLEALAIVETIDEEWAVGQRAWCYNQLAWEDYQRGNYEDGRDWARKGVEVNPEFANAHGTLGSCLYELGEEGAYEAFEACMKLGVDPEQPVRLKDDERYQALAEKYDIPLPTED